VDLLARSYPISATLTAKLGYGFTVWGTSGMDSPLYGYIKPEIKFSTLGTYNSGLVQLKVFPISFLGVIVGAESVSNTSEYRAFDCVLYRCLGKSWQTFVEGNLALGYGPVFVLGRAGVEDWHQAPDQDRDFINPSYGLAMKQQGDRASFAGGIAGYKFSDQWVMAYSYMWVQTVEIKGQSQMNLGLVQWSKEAWNIAVGGGTFHSELKDKEATAILRVQWSGAPSVETF